MKNKTKVLFVCDGNADRSQMAEGFLKDMAGDRFDVYSAGIDPKPINTNAIKAMQEVNINISDHQSQHINDYLDERFDVVITLCDEAKSSCIGFLHDSQVLHWQCPDPESATNVVQPLEAFRHTRDMLKQQIQNWLQGQT